MRILITGGAGFIGAHLADELLEHGHRVRVLDSLSSQVHGREVKRPKYLNPDAELLIEDIRNPAAVRRALKDVDAVYHLAAVVGVGQSMYEFIRYTEVNNLGTAVLMEALLERPVERLIVASSMSIYGEGLYRGPDGTLYDSIERSPGQLRRGDWEVRGPQGEVLEPLPTPESKAPSLASIYALSKFDQERMSLLLARAYGIPAVGLRFFNVYGSNQSLLNPYTGVLAIFASRLLNNRSPLIFEDGDQLRDFVSVSDVVRACRLALDVPALNGQVFNIGSGTQVRIRDLAVRMAALLGKRIEPEIAGKHRAGDIRHCFPDISLARSLLGYSPSVMLENGLIDLVVWLDRELAPDRFSEACEQLAARGLVV
jgi:dTDP-L-rhamnose 4-epimerase